MIVFRSTMAAVSLVLLACGTQTPTPVEAPAEYSLQQAADSVPLTIGKQAHVGGLYLTLTAVSSDSRCPTDVVCVWAGDAVAELTADPPCYKEGCKMASTQLKLHVNMEPRSGEYAGYKVRLLSLAPAPVSTSKIDSSRYVAWVRVTS